MDNGSVGDLPVSRVHPRHGGVENPAWQRSARLEETAWFNEGDTLWARLVVGKNDAELAVAPEAKRLPDWRQEHARRCPPRGQQGRLGRLTPPRARSEDREGLLTRY